MTEKSRFFDSKAGDERKYNAEEFAEYFNQFLSSGVYHQDENPNLEVFTDGTNMQVYIEPGSAYINGYMYKNTEDLYLELDGADSDNDRIDRIVLRLDLTEDERKIRAKILKGTPASSPEPPELTREGDIYELSLAQILVPADTGSLDSGNITDERLDEELCGLVSSLISVPTDEFQEEWDTWFNGIKEESPVQYEHTEGFFKIDGELLKELFLANEQEFEESTQDSSIMENVANSPLAMELISRDKITLNYFVKSKTAMDEIAQKENFIEKYTDRELPMTYITDSPTAMTSLFLEMPVYKIYSGDYLDKYWEGDIDSIGDDYVKIDHYIEEDGYSTEKIEIVQKIDLSDFETICIDWKQTKNTDEIKTQICFDGDVEIEKINEFSRGTDNIDVSDIDESVLIDARLKGYKDSALNPRANLFIYGIYGE